MFANMSGWHLLIILTVILLLFGATRLPALSRSLGQSVRIFKSETKDLRSGGPDADEAPATLAEAPSSPAPESRATSRPGSAEV